jgi:hypothetical protein
MSELYLEQRVERLEKRIADLESWAAEVTGFMHAATRVLHLVGDELADTSDPDGRG